jgi:hypothetical protein
MTTDTPKGDDEITTLFHVKTTLLEAEARTRDRRAPNTNNDGTKLTGSTRTHPSYSIISQL